MTRTLKKLSWADFVALFDSEVHEELANSRRMGTALVLFENMDMCSSKLGARTALRVGPGCSCADLDKAAQIWLNDLPSQRQYPCSYTEDMPEEAVLVTEDEHSK